MTTHECQEVTCSVCHGSGEGLGDMSTCWACKGWGTLPILTDREIMDDDGDAKYDQWNEEELV